MSPAAGSRRRSAAAPAPSGPAAEPEHAGQEHAWLELADMALRRLAVLHRVARGSAPDELAGLRIEDAEVDAVLREVGGGHDPERLASVRDRLDPPLQAARARFAASLEGPGAVAALVANARLGPAEAEVLALALAVELDTRRQRLVAYAQDDVTSTRLRLHTLVSVLGPDHPGPLTVGPGSRLRATALLAVSTEGGWARHELVVPPSVVWALVGDPSPDPNLPHGAAVVDSPVPGEGDLVVVTGVDRVRRREDALGRLAVARVLVSPVPADDAGWEALVREATLTGTGVLVELDEDLPAAGRQWIERATHLAWALTAPHDLPLASLPDRPWTEHTAEAAEPTDDEWDVAFGGPVDRGAGHRLSREQLDQVGRAYRATGDLDAAVRRLVSGRLERLATRIRPARTWDDLVLSPDRLERLHDVVARYRHAGTVYGEWGFRAVPSAGVVVLLSGPSGTGKTLAAEVIAGDLGLDLFKLDLSSVVSKYIGETEKNLEEIFEAAGAGNLVLFFDEADSLFGKRSEVKDARDRYANIEVSYLLQRLERYDGVVILATNYERNIDEAFLRRIHVRVEFAIPDVKERAVIWRANLPAEAPQEDLDLDAIAQQHELAGGTIRNAALMAAFLAAAADGPITTARVEEALAREYHKLGRLPPRPRR